MRTSRRIGSVDAGVVWPHEGTLHRVRREGSAFRFERLGGRIWRDEVPDEEACAAAAAADPEAWRELLAGLPLEQREFLELFACGRMEALLVMARCPALLCDLIEAPALTPFVAAHASLRGTDGARWEEINAVHERSGIFGLLDWLGLPSSRHTLAILRHVMEPDLPRRFLEPLRTHLWEPATVEILEHAEILGYRDLAGVCGGVAA